MKIKSLSKEQKELRRRILEIIHQDHNSHIGSCLGAVDIIDAVFAVKKKKEKFVLSCGHAAVALYAVLEKFNCLKNPSIKNLSVHPNRDVKKGIDVSTGSLGQGLPIALGMALANRKKNVYCLISDGESAEGSIWETFRLVKEFKVYNLKIILMANGWGACDPIDLELLKERIKGFGFNLLLVNGHKPRMLLKILKKTIKGDNNVLVFAETNSDQLPFLHGLGAHYHVMTEVDYLLAMELLEK